MGIMGMISGRRAYSQHVNGNRLIDARRISEGNAAHERAMSLYQQSYEKGMRVPNIMLAYAVLLLRKGQYEKSRDLMREADKLPSIKKDEKQRLRVNFAICQWKLGNLDKAIELMESVSSDRKSSMIYGSLGFMLIEQGERDGNFDKALAYNMEAYDYDEDDAVVLDNLGQLHLRMGNRDKAKEFFARAHEEKPYQVDTLYYLAKLAHEDGQPDKALEYLDDALEGNFSALITVPREAVQALRDQVAREVNLE